MMQPFATLLVASSLAASALAVPLANTSDVVPESLCGPEVGEGTWFNPALGACGITNSDSDPIVAVSWILFDKFPGYAGGNPNNNPICGLKINAEYQGKCVIVTVTDRCTGCAELDLDFSPSAFSRLADPSVGRLYNVTWDFL